MTLTGKVALVTGGAQGLGEAFTKTLLLNGAKVTMLDVNEEKGKETLKKFQSEFGEDKVAFLKASVTSQKEFEDGFQLAKDKFGGLDIVVNNAGVSGETLELWERTVDINLKGTMRGTFLAMENLRKDKGGRGGVIINIASMAGINANPCSPIYNSTKSAIIQLTRSWAMHPELAANGVRINAMAPAFAATPLMDGLSEPQNCHAPSIASKVIDRVGIMTPEYVATEMLELIDDEQKKNGQVMMLAESTGKRYHQNNVSVHGLYAPFAMRHNARILNGDILRIVFNLLKCKCDDNALMMITRRAQKR